METLAAWTKPVEGQAGQNPRVLGKGSGHKAPPQTKKLFTTGNCCRIEKPAFLVEGHWVNQTYHRASPILRRTLGISTTGQARSLGGVS